MKTNSKTTKELYRAKFPLESLHDNAYACMKAVGYLECLMEHNPNTIEWAMKEISMLTFIAFDSILK